MAGIMDGERQFHIQTTPEEVGKYVILPGDPGRVPKIAAQFENARQVAQNREYNVYTGHIGWRCHFRCVDRNRRPVGSDCARGAGALRRAYVYPRRGRAAELIQKYTAAT